MTFQEQKCGTIIDVEIIGVKRIDPLDPHEPCIHCLYPGADPCAQTSVPGVSSNVSRKEHEPTFRSSWSSPLTHL